MSKELLETARTSIEAQRPVRARDIDFNNPYFTQPRHARRYLSDDLQEHLKGQAVQHIYVHVPFCATRCRYCHYPTVTNLHSEENQRLFLRHLEQEIAAYCHSTLDLSQVLTVHVGGGTPNCLNEHNLDRLVTTLQATFRPLVEFAVELYPARADLTEAKLQRMRDSGVNRLSLGVQTFNDAVNEQNNRINQDRGTLLDLIPLAQKYCDNVSIDLLYGQKGQDMSVLEEDCAIAYGLDVNSIYLYQTRELIHKPGVDLQLALNWFLWYFSEHDYEIVSFDQVIKRRNSDGFCAHRSGRSLSENLLGLGPGAVSEIGEFIFRNRDPGAYATDGPGLDPEGIVSRSARTLQAEYVNRALRHYNYPGLNGTWNRKYRERFGSDLRADFNAELMCLRDLGLVGYDDEKIEITDVGMHFTQQINYYLLGHYK
jgi:coproporphyrinogen III oxidase-like Fe-S oxidoreductase